MNRREFFKGLLGVGAMGALALLPKESAAQVTVSPPITHQYSPYEVVHELGGQPSDRYAQCLLIHSSSKENLNRVWGPVYRAFSEAKKGHPSPDGVYYSVTQRG